MTLLNFAFFLAVGRLLIWLLQINGLLREVWQLHPRLLELSRCDLCLGFWVYLIMALFWRHPIFGVWPWPVESVILAAVATMAGHLIVLGWQAKFGTTVIGDD